MADKSREKWGTRLGFILAAVGSAVGLGNMWRFPYLTAEHGGAGFVLFYIVLLFLVGLPVMIGEFILGRSSRRSPVQALAQKGESDWHILGFLFVLTGFGILSYYSVIGGWTIRYMLDSLAGNLLAMEAGAYFEDINTGFDALLFHLLFMGITTGIVLGGVRRGIERSVKLLIPLLVLLSVGLAIWAYFQPGSLEGYEFYLAPEWGRLVQTYSPWGMSITFLNLSLLANAAGQTFFTLSLGMGAMITYASYLSSDEDLIEESLLISVSNFGISFLAGLMIFPIIFSVGLVEQIGESTMGALFITVPEAFRSIGGWWGSLLSLVFFFCLLLAALTSGISLLEVVTSSLIDEFDIRRRPAALASGSIIFLGGIPAALSITWLEVADKIAGNFLLMLGGFFLAIYLGWLCKSAGAELDKGLRLPLKRVWFILIRYVAPPALLGLLIWLSWDLGIVLANLLPFS